MKACFLLQRRFAFLGHKIAVELKKRYSVDEFCAYVYLRSRYDFLKSQTDIHYTELLLDEEIHKKYADEKLDYQYLADLEKKFGLPFLWPYIAIDRVLMHGQLIREYPHDAPLYSYEDMLRILQVKAKAIIDMLEKERPDFVFISVVGGMGSMLLYHVAKKKGIKVIDVTGTRIMGLNALSEDFRHFSWADKLFADFENGRAPNTHRLEAENFLAKFRAAPTPHNFEADPDRQQIHRREHMRFILPKNAWKATRWFLELTGNYLKHRVRDYDDETPWNYLKDKIKRKFRSLIGYEDLYDTPDWDEDFAFFPLHVEPEISTMLHAPYFTDQSWLIRQIAKSLPVSFRLYVKEHPGMVGFRTRRFYRELKKMPNVKLIHPSIKSFKVLENVKLVTTITGSTGWEACLFKKPVITFGDVFYNSLPQVKHCRTIEDLPNMVKDCLENFHHNEDQLINFISALLAESVTTDIQDLWNNTKPTEETERALRPLVDLLAKKVGLAPTGS